MREHTIQLTGNQQLSFDLAGDFIKCLSATGDVTARVEKRSASRILSDGLELSAGVKLRFPERYDFIRLTDTSGANNTIVLLVGEGDHESDSVVGSVTVGNLTATTYDSSADVTLAAGANHDIAANTARRELILEADDGNANNLRVRDLSASSAEGKRLKPGETFTLSCSGAVRVHNPSAGALTFSIAETRG